MSDKIEYTELSHPGVGVDGNTWEDSRDLAMMVIYKQCSDLDSGDLEQIRGWAAMIADERHGARP